MLSVLIPVFNEERAVEETVRQLNTVLSGTGEVYEIVVVNDGSTDRTADILRSITDIPQLRVLSHQRNRGYGASLKLGIRHAQGELIGMTDADGTYPVDMFPALLTELHSTEADMVVGARTKKGAAIPLIRKPAKMIVNSLARLLTGMRIPDLNSGMRIFRRELAERYMHLYPQRFSFTITITLAALTNDELVRWIPIDYGKREGKSSLSSGFNGIANFLNFLSLVVRMVTLFRPLKFFIWPASLLFLGGLAHTVSTLVMEQNVSDSGVLLLVSGLQIGLFGLLAETVVRHRQ
ncbi:MAG: glycosyltransferase family 2 protein [Patescibacteria group bacterium]